MNTSALITIKEISDGILFKKKIPESESARITQFVLDGYRELNLIVLTQGNVLEYYEMDANKTILMPDDLIKIHDIFVPKDNMLWSLTRNTRIPTVTKMELGQEYIPEDWGGGDDIIHNTGSGYNANGGVNQDGYYDLDYVSRIISFRNVDRSEVMISYKSSGISRTTETYVPLEAKSALEMYVMHQMTLFGLLPMNASPLYEKEYNKQKGILRLMDFNFTQFKDAVYSTITSTFKR